MSTSNNGSTGIHIENCTDVTLEGNKTIGFDTGIRAVNITGITARDNVNLSRSAIDAINRRDPQALLLSLGLPAEAPKNIAAEALTQVAEGADIRNTRLATYLGAAADLIGISQAFYSVINSKALSAVLSVLNG